MITYADKQVRNGKKEFFIALMIIIISFGLLMIAHPKFITNKDLSVSKGELIEYYIKEKRSGGKFSSITKVIVIKLKPYPLKEFEIDEIEHLDRITNFDLNKDPLPKLEVWSLTQDLLQKNTLAIYGLKINNDFIISVDSRIRKNARDVIIFYLLIFSMFCLSVFQLMNSINKIRQNRSLY